MITHEMPLVRAFDGTPMPARLERMNCGGVPVFDVESGMSYRCDACFAVIGSIGQPQRCKDINNGHARNPPR